MTACGKELLLSLFFLVLKDLYCLPEGNRSDRGKKWWVLPLMMLVILLRQHDRTADDLFALFWPSSRAFATLLQCSMKTTLWCSETGCSRSLSGKRLPAVSVLFFFIVPSQEVLLCLFNDSPGVDDPARVSWNGGSQEGEAVDPFHAVTVSVEWGWVYSWSTGSSP